MPSLTSSITNFQQPLVQPCQQTEDTPRKEKYCYWLRTARMRQLPDHCWLSKSHGRIMQRKHSPNLQTPESRETGVDRNVHVKCDLRTTSNASRWKTKSLPNKYTQYRQSLIQILETFQKMLNGNLRRVSAAKNFIELGPFNIRPVHSTPYWAWKGPLENKISNACSPER